MRDFERPDYTEAGGLGSSGEEEENTSLKKKKRNFDYSKLP